MVTLALFYQTQATTHLLFFCKRGGVPIIESVISHFIFCSHFALSRGTRLNYSDLEIRDVAFSRFPCPSAPVLSLFLVTVGFSREPTSCHRSTSNTSWVVRSSCLNFRKRVLGTISNIGLRHQASLIFASPRLLSFLLGVAKVAKVAVSLDPYFTW